MPQSSLPPLSEAQREIMEIICSSVVASGLAFI